jgi:recombination protein RecA
MAERSVKQDKQDKQSKQEKMEETKQVLDAGRKRALEVAISQIEKEYGRGSIMRLGAGQVYSKIEAIPTGSLALDIAIGIGGVPRGRVIEIYGPEGSGKTTLGLQIAANAQKMGGVAAFVDAEHAMDPLYAQKLGVDIENLLISQPDNGEQALEITDTLVHSSAIDVVIVDSVAALVPRVEIEGQMGDTNVALQARLMSQALRKLTASIQKSRTCVIFINQIREKVGVFFGNPEVTPGGRALKFYASVRLEIRRIAPIKRGDSIVGNRVRVKVAKNKVASPFRRSEFSIYFGEGISREESLLDIGVEKNIVQKSGTWYLYGDQRLGQGIENARNYLKENQSLVREIEQKIRETAFTPSNKS